MTILTMRIRTQTGEGSTRNDKHWSFFKALVEGCLNGV